MSDDLCLLLCGLIAMIVYVVLALLNVPFIAFCWLIFIPLYLGMRFATR